MYGGLDIIIITIIVVIICIYYFEPKIDIIITGKGSYKVLLWYNKCKFNKRSYIELFRIEKDK